jgi:hypothetical protein
LDAEFAKREAEALGPRQWLLGGKAGGEGMLRCAREGPGVTAGGLPLELRGMGCFRSLLLLTHSHLFASKATYV